jgi:hypothetical protein
MRHQDYLNESHTGDINMSELDKWPGSILDRIMTADAVGKFLRTHRNGDRLLWEWLNAVPSDRTEEEYKRECQEERERYEALIRTRLEEINAHQRARGGNEIDRQGNIVRGPGAPRNRNQLKQVRSERQQIEALLKRHPRMQPKEILRTLGWPLEKLRAVQRHVKAIARG